MITQKLNTSHIQMIEHLNRRVISIQFASRTYSQSVALIYDYAFLLSSSRPGDKALVLVDFEDALFELRLALAWKAHLELFSDRVEKSAIIGASRLAQTAIHGFAQSASLLGYPLGPHRAVVFSSREKALDWLAG